MALSQINRQNHPVDGNWSQYGEWGHCSAPCGSGNRTRNRTCTNPEPQYGGANCTGIFSRIQECNTFACGRTLFCFIGLLDSFLKPISYLLIALSFISVKWDKIISLFLLDLSSLDRANNLTVSTIQHHHLTLYPLQSSR